MAKILIIDDEKIIRERMKNILELDDYVAVTAKDGREGLEVFDNEKPEIAVVDLKMPGMSGLEVLKKIKEKSKYTEVIIMTGHGGIEAAIEAMRAGAFAYIQKPDEHDELEIEIKRALEKQKIQEKLDEHLVELERTVEEKNREIERRKNVEVQLQNALQVIEKNEQQFRSVVETANDAIISLDSNGIIIFWNRSAEIMFGWSADYIVGKSVATIIPERYLEAHKKKFEKARSQCSHVLSSKPMELYANTEDGKEIPIELSVASWEIGEGKFFTAILRDILERKETQEQIKSQQQQLIQADKMASLGTIAAGIAHEINNPLTVSEGDIHMFGKDYEKIIDFVKCISDMPLSPDESEEFKKLKESRDVDYICERGGEKVTRCKESMKRIHDIISQLKDFSHIDTGKIEPTDINKQVKNALQMIPPHFKGNIEIITKLNAIPEIHCNNGQINQVFVNIIVNALQAMKEKGTLTLETFSNEKYVCIKFIDTGPGLPAEKIIHIFEPFYTTKPTGEGTGLGLSISYSIIEQHKGVIIVANNPEKGLTFIISLLKDNPLLAAES